MCQIEFVLDQNDLKLKNRHWYQFRPKYYRAEYEVRAIIGTGLKFQIWGRNGLKSKDHDEIEVLWQPVSANQKLQRKPTQTDTAMYRW